MSIGFFSRPFSFEPEIPKAQDRVTDCVFLLLFTGTLTALTPISPELFSAQRADEVLQGDHSAGNTRRSFYHHTLQLSLPRLALRLSHALIVPSLCPCALSSLSPRPIWSRQPPRGNTLHRTMTLAELGNSREASLHPIFHSNTASCRSYFIEPGTKVRRNQRDSRDWETKAIKRLSTPSCIKPVEDVIRQAELSSRGELPSPPVHTSFSNFSRCKCRDSNDSESSCLIQSRRVDHSTNRAIFYIEPEQYGAMHHQGYILHRT
ncbi:hypothetical protein RRG08_033414 [Elysia crispata]|uniref:Uncharacterized protein n=1 Tax=Elysia crispata TaxID=231223 RepID=A0AAE1ATR9_9GAST|nr:hypothetical protein RRG08_033414 [Elysia crispata]